MKKFFKGRVSQNIVAYYAAEMLEAVKHLQNKEIVHADIKLDNWMLQDGVSNCSDKDLTDSYPNCVWNAQHAVPAVVLIDFGRAIDLKLHKQGAAFQVDYKKSRVCVPGFCAPSIMYSLPWKYDLDMFAVASTIHCLIQGETIPVKRGVVQVPSEEWLPRRGGWDRQMWKALFDLLVLSSGDEKCLRGTVTAKHLVDNFLSEREKNGRRRIQATPKALRDQFLWMEQNV